MNTGRIERVFGRERVKMVTGDHVEVFREAAAPGERRRYTKRFLATNDADFRQWTHREWRILARLIGHGVRCVPDVVQYHGDAEGGMRQLQTYDAGITVDQWATMLPVARDGVVQRNVFEDCANWWALAHHSLAALDEIHALHVVHLDFKADNICIPFAPAAFDHDSRDERLSVDFARLSLIDFAFSLVSRDSLTTPLPIGWEKDYDYQSPRLLCALEAGRAGDLVPTQELDWRCDLYSLAAMLRRYLGDEHDLAGGRHGWTAERRADARSLIYRLRGCHDGELPQHRPHRDLMELTAAELRAPDLAASLAQGWTLVRDSVTTTAEAWVTPITRVVAAGVPPTRITLVHASTSRTGVPPTFTVGGVSATAPSPSPATFTLGDVGSTASSPVPANSTDSAHTARSIPIPDAIPAVVRTRRVAQGSALRDRSRDGRTRKRQPPRQRNEWIASAVVSLASLSALTYLGRDVPLFDMLREGVGQLRSYAIAERSLEHPTQATVATDQAQKAIDSLQEQAVATDHARKGAESAGEVKIAAAEEPARPTGASAPASSDADVLASPPRAESPATAAEIVEESPSASTLAQPRTTRSSSSGAAKRSSRDAATKPSASRSTPATAAPRSPRPPSSNVAQARSRQPQSTQSASGDRGPAFPYDPVAARSATAYLTMRATRLDPMPGTSGSLSSGDAQGATTASIVTPPSIAPDGVIVAPLASASAVAAAPGNPSSVGTMPAAEASANSRPKTVAPGNAPSGSRSMHRNDWRDGLSNLLALIGIRSQRPAAIEERSLRPERPTGATGIAADGPRNPSTNSSSRAPEPARAPSQEPRTTAQVASSHVAQISAAIPPPVVPAPEPLSASPLPPPVPSSQWNAPPAPTTRPPLVVDSRPGASPKADADLGLRARRMLAEAVPRVAAQARADASQVLAMASVADHPLHQRQLIDAAYVTWRSEQAYPPSSIDDARARRYYHENARQAFVAGRNVDALDLELRAFAADPRDAEISGFLAYLYLQVVPAEAETARQLALHALAFSGSRRSIRFEDWNTFAVASALTGRDADAARAFIVELTLSGDAERTCRAALRAYSTFGERLRGPVETLMQRIRSGPEPAACASNSYRLLARTL